MTKINFRSDFDFILQLFNHPGSVDGGAGNHYFHEQELR